MNESIAVHLQRAMIPRADLDRREVLIGRQLRPEAPGLHRTLEVHDPLRAARGCVYGLLYSLGAWAVLFAWLLIAGWLIAGLRWP